MHIHPCFQQNDKNKLLPYISEYPFGILLTAQDNLPWATYIPFVVEEENNSLVWYTHLLIGK